MIRKLHRSFAATVVVGLLTALCLVTPVAAQSASPNATTPASPCIPGTENPGLTAKQKAAQPTTVGIGPDDAGAPLDCWLALSGHQTHWYKFRYGYNARTDNPPHQANVELAMNMAGCFSFELWTPERLQAAKDDPAVGPVGTGSPKFTPADPKSSSSKNQIPTILTWSGSQAGSSTFYVIVKNRTDNACTYHLAITGDSVFYPKKTK